MSWDNESLQEKPLQAVTFGFPRVPSRPRGLTQLAPKSTGEARDAAQFWATTRGQYGPTS